MQKIERRFKACLILSVSTATIKKLHWKDETGMIRFLCPNCGTVTVSKEKSRRHIQIDMYAPKGEVLRSRIEY